MMKRNVKDATLTVDDLRKIILNRSLYERINPRDAMDPDEDSETGRDFTHYILASVIGIVVAMLVISMVS